MIQKTRTTLNSQRREVARDQVRVAYGALPVVLESLSANDPMRAEIRERARSWLIEQGFLTAEELATLQVKAAITAVMRR